MKFSLTITLLAITLFAFQVSALEDKKESAIVIADEKNSTNSTSLDFHLSLCPKCTSEIEGVIRKYGCGTAFLKVEDCLALVETVIGAIACEVLIRVAKDVVTHECVKHTPIGKISTEVADKVCHTVHLCK